MIPNSLDHREAGVGISRRGTCLAFRQYLFNSGCRDDADPCPALLRWKLAEALLKDTYAC